MNYSQMALAAIQAALLAGELLQQKFNTAHQITSKEGKQNLVTECDLESEGLILSFLQKQFPSHSFLSEESGLQEAHSEILWVIDPLDGTINFARNIPHFSVSIAACRGTDVLAGVVYQPMTKELFVAEKGGGAFLQGKRLRIPEVYTLDQSLLATGFPYNVDENPMQCIQTFSHFLYKGLPIRRLGSAAIDLAYLAAGRFDVYWETGIKPWDIAAGILLVQEAGGVISTWEGDPHPIITPAEILVTNGQLHKIMVEALRKGRI